MPPRSRRSRVLFTTLVAAVVVVGVLLVTGSPLSEGSGTDRVGSTAASTSSSSTPGSSTPGSSAPSSSTAASSAPSSSAVPDRGTWPVVDRFDGARVHQQDDGYLTVPARRNGRLVVYVHGASQHGASAYEDPNVRRVTSALLDRGYVVASADAGGNAWGNADSVADYRQLVRRARSQYGLGRVYVVAESMGGLAGAVIAGDPEVRAWVGIFPVCDVASLSRPDLLAQIAAVYPSGAPATLSPVRWPEKPVIVWASSGDSVVPADGNGRACAAAVGGRSVRTTGDHGDPSDYDGPAVVAFFDAH